MTDAADVIVVGLGVAGEQVAGELAEAGLDVVGIESGLVGGECPYWGCIPSKMMVRAANLLAEGRRIDGMAGTSALTPDWAPVARRIREEATDNWDDRVAVERFTGKGGQFVRGSAKLVGARRVQVDDRMIDARRGIVIAAGSVPVVPPINGLAGTPYWTNREAIEAATLPGSLLVLGGGAIGVELAQMFARFGVEVTVIEAADRLLPMEEPESSALVRNALAADGVKAHLGSPANSVSHDASGFTVQLDDGTSRNGERLLVAIGRRPNLKGLGLEAAGLDPKAGVIAVDERMRAGDGIWAVGDLTGHGAFTHIAMYQAGIAIRDILGRQGPPAAYHAVPRVTFTDPEVGGVGLTEAQARGKGLDIRTAFTEIPSSSRGWIHKAGNDGFIKLVLDAERGVLVGATSAGPAGGEVLSALALATHVQMPISAMRSMIYAFPTFHRAIEAALAGFDG